MRELATHQIEARQRLSGKPALASELAACCLLRTGRYAEAEDISRKQSDAGNRGGAYYLGLALFAQGRVVEAIAPLQEVTHQPHYGSEASQALLKILRCEAEQRMAQRDWKGAGEAVSQALALYPENRELKRMLTALGDHLPVMYLKGNKRAEAAAAWEKSQKQGPINGNTTHSLALLYFWWSQALEEQNKGEEAVAAWEGAIRNWVALCYDERFWTDWRAEREQVFGKVPDEAVENLRRKLTEQLSRKIADYQNDYLTRKRADDAHRLGLLSLELSAELKTADALKRVSESLSGQGKETAELPPLCGVIMLKHLGQLETAQKLLSLVQTTQTNAANTEKLHWCLSPWVAPWIMVEERRYEEAIALLEKRLKKDSSSNDGHDLLATAYLERGRVLAATGEVDQALDAWNLALDHVRSRMKKTDEINEWVEKAAIREATRLQKEDGTGAVEKAIKILEKAMTIVKTDRLKQNLSEVYRVLAGSEFDDKFKSESTRKENAKRRLEKALEIDPNNGQAKRELSMVLSNMGVDKCDSAYNRNDSTWNEGVRMLKEASRLDPTNEHALKKLMAIGETPDVDIDTLLRLHRNR